MALSACLERAPQLLIPSLNWQKAYPLLDLAMTQLCISLCDGSHVGVVVGEGHSTRS